MLDNKRIIRILLAILLTLGVVPFAAVKAEGPADPAPYINPIGTANGKSILFDNTHGQTAGAADWVIDGAFSDFGNALAAEGYYVKELRKQTAITLSDLADYAVFVIPEANIPYKTSEQQAMVDYVAGGGSIFFIADHYNADRNKNRWDSSEAFNGYRRGAWSNPVLGMSTEEAASAAMSDVSSSDWLASNFGMRLRYNAIGNVNSDYIVPAAQAFGITTGVTTVSMHAGSTIAITDPNKAKGIVYIENTTSAWPNAVDQGVYEGGGLDEGPYAAVAKVGLGKAAAIGDSSPVEDITPKYKREETGGTKTTYDGFLEVNNGVLLVNIVNWLAVKESYTALNQVSGLTLDTATSLLEMETPSTSTEPETEPWASPAEGYKWWDSSTFKAGSYGYVETGGGSGGGGTEDFENGTKTSYAAADVTLASGSWRFDNSLIGDLSTDKKNGMKSARLKAAGFIAMNFNVAGAASVTVKHANFGTDTGANWKLQKSTDSGSTWTDVGGTFTSGSTLASQTITVNEAGSVRFKIVAGGTSGHRVNIDDVVIAPIASSVEPFESGTKTAYAAADVTLATGSWRFDNALIGDLSTDKKNGTKSARIKAAGFITMNFNVASAAAVVVKHANFSSDTGTTWKLQKSTDNGSTWTDVSGTYTSGSALTSQTITVNETGSVRFKIVVGGTSGSRMNIDDFEIS